jgi:hypothetical protein
VAVTIGGVSDTFTITTRATDLIPDQFTFIDQAGVTRSATITSAAVTITGLDSAITFTATNGTIDKNADANFQTTQSLTTGDTMRARHTASASYATSVNTSVSGGGISDTFTSTTIGDPALGGGVVISSWGWSRRK